jgi:hypothetical protein
MYVNMELVPKDFGDDCINKSVISGDKVII